MKKNTTFACSIGINSGNDTEIASNISLTDCWELI